MEDPEGSDGEGFGDQVRWGEGPHPRTAPAGEWIGAIRQPGEEFWVWRDADGREVRRTPVEPSVARTREPDAAREWLDRVSAAPGLEWWDDLFDSGWEQQEPYPESAPTRGPWTGWRSRWRWWWTATVTGPAWRAGEPGNRCVRCGRPVREWDLIASVTVEGHYGDEFEWAPEPIHPACRRRAEWRAAGRGGWRAATLLAWFIYDGAADLATDARVLASGWWEQALRPAVRGTCRDGAAAVRRWARVRR